MLSNFPTFDLHQQTNVVSSLIFNIKQIHTFYLFWA